jgi:pimeloyl-ACP methyl ester carboxylesterase
LVDWLGSGFSDPPQQFSYSLDDHAATAAALLDHLGLKACVVVGHSMGGAIAIALATARPDLVAQLVLAEANLDAGGGFMSKRIAEQTETDFVAHGYQKILTMMRKQSNSGDNSANVALGMLQIAAPHALYRSAASLVQGTQPVMRDQLLNLSIPRSFIFGDQSLPDDKYEQLPTHDIKVAIIPNAGHGMMWDNPAGFAEVVASWLTD